MPSLRPNNHRPFWRACDDPKSGVFWLCRTADTLAEVLDPEYFNSIVEHGIRRNDIVHVIASADGEAEHALMVCDHVQDGEGEGGVSAAPRQLTVSD